MKTALTTVFLLMLLACSALAAGPVAPTASVVDKEFAQQKTEKLKKLDERIKLLQARRACIQAAGDQKAYEVCNEKYKSAN